MIDIKKALTSEYAPAYTATNEDIRWIVDAYPSAHDILTVAGSGDQALFYAQNGTRHVDTFDITRMAKMIQDIKTTALQHLNHTEYKQFIVDICRHAPNPNTSKIIANMPDDSRELLVNPLPPMKFKTRITIDNPNLPTWTEYEHMRKNITQPFNFICAPLSTLGKHITKQYDIINVSNIFDNFYGDNLSSAGAQMETIMGLCANGVGQLLNRLLPMGKLGELIALGGCALTGMAVYFLLTLALKVPEAKLSVGLIQQLRKRG